MEFAPQSTPRYLPPELWDHVVSYLRYDLDALLAYREAYCGRVWDKRATKYVPPEYDSDPVIFFNRKEVARIGRMKSSWTGPRNVDIEGYEHTRQIPHLATFAAMFGGRWTKTEELGIMRADWPAWEMPPDVFRSLATFTGITWLYLHDVKFPSIATFGRLVCALPTLEWLYLGLYCDKVRIETRRAFPRWAGATQLSRVSFDDMDGAFLNDISGFLVSMGISAKLTKIELAAVETNLGPGKPLRPEDFQPGNVQHLVQSAGASLRRLQLHLVPGGEPYSPLLDIKSSEQSHPYFQNTTLIFPITRSSPHSSLSSIAVMLDMMLNAYLSSSLSLPPGLLTRSTVNPPLDETTPLDETPAYFGYHLPDLANRWCSYGVLPCHRFRLPFRRALQRSIIWSHSSIWY